MADAPRAARAAPAAPAPGAARFAAQRLVRFSDCDPAGIVFFPNYFLMLNGVVEDWWQHLGHPWSDTVTRRRLGTPTAQLDSTFALPSRLGETLAFELTVEHLGRSSLRLAHRVLGPDGSERVRLAQRLVATSLDTHRPIAWPADIHQAISQFQDSHFQEKGAPA